MHLHYETCYNFKQQLQQKEYLGNFLLHLDLVEGLEHDQQSVQQYQRHPPTDVYL